jgi:hypothetical protein
MPSRKSDQDEFAVNLQSKAHGGIAVYHPPEFLLHSGRVGDLGYFDQRGNYEWIHNAFHTEVHIYGETSDFQDLRLHNWPILNLAEETAITETSQNHDSKIAIGGSVKMTKTHIELGGTAPVGPAAGHLS